jgi:hypothetical protein
MQVRVRLFSLCAWSAVFAVVLLFATRALAQSMDDAAPFLALSGIMLMFVLVLGLGSYIYLSLALQTIANKTATANAWLAWIPIANLFLLLSVAKKPLWWFLLFLIPLVNLIILIMVWMAVAEARHKPNWWGILLIVPVVNIIVPGYLAWAD